ncbi:hypothetical protein ACHAWO_012787 [Cyclotella atomus]|uniref:Uncharacterized protein n=1 Tax=Cyclotella atomus TaxID=382360 RepID=A0ABD3NPK1_9STRA
MTFNSIIHVPTFKDDASQERQGRPSDMSPQDLVDLKTRNPFMYHSIPAVREAERLHKDVDASILTSDGASNVVMRQKRISFECYDSKLLIDDMLVSNADNRNENDGDDDDTEDGLYSYLAQLERESNHTTSTSLEVQTAQASAAKRQSGIIDSLLAEQFRGDNPQEGNDMEEEDDGDEEDNFYLSMLLARRQQQD